MYTLFTYTTHTPIYDRSIVYYICCTVLLYTYIITIIIIIIQHKGAYNLVVLMSSLESLWTRSVPSPIPCFTPRIGSTLTVLPTQPPQYCELIKILFTVNWRGDFQVFRRHHFAALPSPPHAVPLTEHSPNDCGMNIIMMIIIIIQRDVESTMTTTTTTPHTRALELSSFTAGRNPWTVFIFDVSPYWRILYLDNITYPRYSYAPLYYILTLSVAPFTAVEPFWTLLWLLCCCRCHPNRGGARWLSIQVFWSKYITPQYVRIIGYHTPIMRGSKYAVK